MIDATDIRSLLPYIATDKAKIRIDFLVSDFSSEESDAKFPFRVLNDSSPLASLIEADIITDSECKVQTVFLMVQKDEYRYQPNPLWPLTNLDIDASWREAFTYYIETGHHNGFIHIAGLNGNPRESSVPSGCYQSAFNSLFFCSFRRIFFHPPCPVCGSGLSLCKDDSLLSSQGLGPYSSTLRRYMFCPSCPPGMGGDGFFVSSSKASDPSGVRDRNGLISSWRYLLASGLASEEFPCASCPLREKCYGAENLSSIRIVPFSFFPFHMIILKAKTIRAVDFIPLLSGGRFDEIESRLFVENEPDRVVALRSLKHSVAKGELFLFFGKPGHFLEVLYLKLSLLYDLTEMLLKAPAPLDIMSALDNLWVNIPDQNSLLPRFWNFRAGYTDIGLVGAAAAGYPGSHPALISYFVGVIWFYVLLSNKSLPAPVIISELASLIGQNEGQPYPFQGNPLFGHKNIFWSPEMCGSDGFPPEWKGLWNRALEMAWTILTADRTGGDWFSDILLVKLSALRIEIKTRLFEVGQAPLVTVTTEEANRAIRKILNGIMQNAHRIPSTVESKPIAKVDNFEETVVSSRDVENHFDQTQVMPPDVTIPRKTVPVLEEPEAETVIIRPENKAEALNTADEMATVILAPPHKPEPVSAPVGISGIPDSGNLEKTVVINNRIHIAPAVTESNAAAEQKNDELCETILIPRKALSASLPPPVPPPLKEPPLPVEEDDLMSETIILHTPRKKD